MDGITNALILIAVLIGHGGLHVAVYNRLNALGWRRVIIKSLTKFFFLTAILLPIALLVFRRDALRAILFQSGTWDLLGSFWCGYGLVCVLAWLVFGIPWLLWRPIFRLEWVDAPRQVRVVDVQRTLGRSLALTAKARFETGLPLNQVFELSVEEIELPVVGLPERLDGYRIAHLSDIHLTGEVDAGYAKYAVETAARAKPDLFALTGDIIDSRPCVDWLFDIFSPAQARDGCFFILGNHDTRIADSRETRRAMDRAGWIDLGSQSSKRQLGGVPSLVIGNESPWYRGPEVEPGGADEFRLLLSHSPDQFLWARRNGVHLMLAGHTHGGQGRLPLAGPILSPSRHGSRYASGDFFRSPTTMHVTRGVGGVHLMRINCRPELSLLTLRVSSAG